MAASAIGALVAQFRPGASKPDHVAVSGPERSASFRRRARNCATSPRPAAISCSARAVIISTTRLSRCATSATPGAAAARSKATTASTPFSARASNASPRIRATCAWRWPRSTRSCACRVRKASARFRSPISIASPATRRTSRPIFRPNELITAVDLPAIPFATPLALFESARPRELRLRPRQRGRGFGNGGRTNQIRPRIALGGVAHKPWRAHKAERPGRQNRLTTKLPRRGRSRAGRRQRLQAQLL